MSLLDDASLIVTPNGYKAQVLYSVKPTSGAGDMVVTRGSSATRVNSAGLIEMARTNLVLQSQTFTNVYWTQTNVTVTANTTAAPDGTTTADTVLANGVSSAHTVASDVISFTAGTSYSLSVFVKKGTNDFVQLFVGAGIGGMYANFNINTGAIGSVGTVGGNVPTSSITNFGGGWYRCIMNFTATLTNIVPAKFVIVTSATASREESNTLTTSVILWGAQLETSNIAVATEYIPTIASIRTKFAGITQDGGFASNIPRIDYTGGGCPSILVEPLRTNLALRSEELDSALIWFTIAATVTANNTTSPDGTVNADKVVATAVPGIHVILQQPAGSVSGTTVTVSVFAKAAGLSRIQFVNNAGGPGVADFILSGVGSATPSSATIIPVGNDGWYRCTMTYTPITTGNYNIQIRLADSSGSTSFTGNAVDGVSLWGFQIEAGSTETSYIPTVAGTVTRNADVISKTGVSSLIGQTEGTIFVEANLTANTDDRRIIMVSDGTELQRIMFWTLATTLYANFNGVSITIGTFPIGTAKMALAYTIAGGSTTYSIKLNNNALITATAAAAPTPLTNINLGTNTNSLLNLNDRIKLVTLFKTALSPTQLANLTAI